MDEAGAGIGCDAPLCTTGYRAGIRAVREDENSLQSGPSGFPEPEWERDFSCRGGRTGSRDFKAGFPPGAFDHRE